MPQSSTRAQYGGFDNADVDFCPVSNNMDLEQSILHFQFEHFESIPQDDSRDNETLRHSQRDCKNHVWGVYIYPGGCSDEDDVDENDGENRQISILLCSNGADSLTVRSSIIVRNALGCVECAEDRSINRSRKPMVVRHDIPRTRSQVLDKNSNILVGMALIVEVEIQYFRAMSHFKVPRNQLNKNMLKLLDNIDDADVVFKVSDETMHAHNLILKANSPDLYSICQGCTKEKPIPIDDVTPEIFRFMLEYIYGGKAPEAEYTLKNGKAIIDAANRYGVSGLKMIAESTLVSKRVVDISNVADYIFFADAKTCPLLKEYAISYFIAHSKDILKSKYLAKLKESGDLMEEIMSAMADGMDRNAAADTVESMSVNELRIKLDGFGLDMDGSKDILISRLKDASSKRKRGR